MKKLIAVAAVLLMATSCGEGSTKQDAPEPSPENIKNGTHTQVIQMPDGFRNIAFTCYGTTGIYVTSRGGLQATGNNSYTTLPSSIAVLDKDPKCSSK